VSEQNVELHRRIHEAFNARDLEALIACCDPQVEFHSPFAAVGGLTVYRGHEGMRKWHQDLEEAWEGEIRVEPEAYFDLGEQTLAYLVLQARGWQSRVETAMHLAQVATWRNGLMVSFKSYPDRQAALRELGVSQDALEIAP
jgi:ketosteroid isomerase-like protein